MDKKSEIMRLKEMSQQLGEIADKLLTEYQTPIENLNLHTRVQNCLHRYGIQTVEELIKLSLDDLLRMRNFGMYCAEQLNEKARAFGLKGWDI